MIEFFQTYVFPIIALIIPVLMIFKKKKGNTIDIPKNRLLRLSSLWIIFTLIIISALSYLSNGLSYIWQTTPSRPKIFEGTLQWDITEHIQLLMPLYLFNNLIVVSILSGLLYSSLISLPAVCETKKMGESTISSVSAAVSSVGSGVVCCSTSAIAVIAPAVGIIIGPYVPVLLVFSQLLLLYSFNRVVVPRLPIFSK